MGTFLKIENVSKSYGGVKALKNVDLEVLVGEIHGLVGENGSGKSTLVKIITGVVEPQPGAVLKINGKVFNKLTPIMALRMGIHVVHQDLSLFPNLSVAENIAIHDYVEGSKHLVNWKKIREVALNTVSKLGVDVDLDATVGSLSLADQQIVAICRAIASEAKLIILDEPTASLTSLEVARLFEFLKKLKDRGISIIFISHRLDEVLEISDRVTVLRDGTKVGTFSKSDLDKKKLAYLMTGKELDYGRKSSRTIEKAKPVLELRNLTKRGQFENVSFTLRRGEILGITGPRGSGRTELALAVFGMNRPDSGNIFVEGKRVEIRSNRDAISLGIGYVPENRLVQGLVLDQPVVHNVVLTVLDKLVGKLFIDESKKRSVATEMIEKLRVKTAGLFVPVKTLSGGNQQKIVLAKWMLTNPKVFILDGPTTGIDVAAKESIYSIIRDLADRGVGIIMISDEALEVMKVSDRILLMKGGRIVDELMPDEITEEELVRRIKE